MFTVATWNVNSIRVRLERVLAWLAAKQPDVLCLQETKVEDKDFPYMAFEMAGYQAAHFGQKTYNGVAILSKEPLQDVHNGLDGDDEDFQCRLIAATVHGCRILSAYFPNGESLESPKYQYKLRWLARLQQHLVTRCDPAAPLVLCGDFNIAPEPRDVHAPELWEQSTLYHTDVRAAFLRLQEFGFVDTYRLHVQDPGKFSWWDYRMLAFPKNQGLRIDHVLATRPLADKCVAAEIDRNERKGKQPSDHAPVLATFDF
jgi:exodeoxyribonuclease-3